LDGVVFFVLFQLNQTNGANRAMLFRYKYRNLSKEVLYLFSLVNPTSGFNQVIMQGKSDSKTKRSGGMTTVIIDPVQLGASK
jgi:hypothetical protein